MEPKQKPKCPRCGSQEVQEETHQHMYDKGEEKGPVTAFWLCLKCNNHWRPVAG